MCEAVRKAGMDWRISRIDDTRRAEREPAFSSDRDGRRQRMRRPRCLFAYFSVITLAKRLPAGAERAFSSGWR
ncbi:hypothetical protein KCP69_22185 [Salmonella enterica subsp. enterica]|nr:hypothetical protein KCP69_22185 [Salmonella enterica subsp. enterica]